MFGGALAPPKRANRKRSARARNALDSAGMRVVRYRDPEGNVAHGVEGADGKIRRLEGDLFGERRVSSAEARVAKLLAPVVPTEILCIGLNYRKHAEETRAAIPERPVLFM